MLSRDYLYAKIYLIGQNDITGSLFVRPYSNYITIEDDITLDELESRLDALRKTCRGSFETFSNPLLLASVFIQLFRVVADITHSVSCGIHLKPP